MLRVFTARWLSVGLYVTFACRIHNLGQYLPITIAAKLEITDLFPEGKLSVTGTQFIIWQRK